VAVQVSSAAFAFLEDIMKEQWHDVVGFEELYKVSNFGRVKTIKKYSRFGCGYILKPKPTARGYARVTLRGKQAQRSYFIHVLVLEAFVCPRPPGKVSNHKNSDKTDNRVENLEWVTQQENVAHAVENDHFFTPRGEQHGESKLTANDVREIRRLYARGQYTQRDLAQRFSVSKSLISAIIRRHVWKHV